MTTPITWHLYDCNPVGKGAKPLSAQEQLEWALESYMTNTPAKAPPTHCWVHESLVEVLTAAWVNSPHPLTFVTPAAIGLGHVGLARVEVAVVQPVKQPRSVMPRITVGRAA